jgi:hypothetical protein
VARPPGGEVKKYGKDETLDIASSPNDVYDEARLKRHLAARDAEAGTVFGYQSVGRGAHRLLAVRRGGSRTTCPRSSSRYTLTLPAGWRAGASPSTTPKLDPAVAGTTYTWELRDLAPVEDEPNEPDHVALAPRLAVSYFPPAGAPMRTFETWADVARWS